MLLVSAVTTSSIIEALVLDGGLLGAGRLVVIGVAVAAITVIVGDFTTVIEVRLVVFGEASSHLLKVNIFLIPASIPVHALVFFMVSRAEAALNFLFERAFILVAALV